jgi:Zn-finger nucleic acid-binding protein
MSVEEGQAFFHCQYCGGYDFPEPNQDGVALLDETSSFVCPICEGLLVSAVIKDIYIFSCPKCRGNLIKQSKMLPILREAKPQDPKNADSRDIQDKSELTRNAACPACHQKMAVYPYGGPGNIIIQGCEQCKLIWLDFGELSRIVRAYREMYNDSAEERGAKKQWISF